MAFFKNGERYHTKDDNFENIPPGSFQHAGDNTLVLVRQLANAPEVMDPKTSSDEVIYFDFLGLFLVSYAATTGYIMNIIVSLASFATYGLSIYIFKLGTKFHCSIGRYHFAISICTCPRFLQTNYKVFKFVFWSYNWWMGYRCNLRSLNRHFP